MEPCWSSGDGEVLHLWEGPNLPTFCGRTETYGAADERILTIKRCKECFASYTVWEALGGD